MSDFQEPENEKDIDRQIREQQPKKKRPLETKVDVCNACYIKSPTGSYRLVAADKCKSPFHPTDQATLF